MKLKSIRNLTRIARRLKADRRGVSAIEFALIFPVMIVLLAGVTDLGQALMVHRKINEVVATASDLVSQQSTWSASQLDGILQGTASIMLPFSSDDLKLTVSIVDIDASNNAKVNWSRSYGTTPLPKGTPSPVDIPANIVEKDVQLVVATATYSLTTPFSQILKGVVGSSSYEYSRFSLMRPRGHNTVQLN